MSVQTIGHIRTDIGNMSLANRPEPFGIGGVSPIDSLVVEPRYRFTDDATIYMANRQSGPTPPAIDEVIQTEAGDYLQTEAGDYLAFN